MKLKLDENLGKRVAELFQAAGYDAATVPGQRMAGATDSELIKRCHDEGRAIVPSTWISATPCCSSRLSIMASRFCDPQNRYLVRGELEDLCRTLIGGLSLEKLDGKLWIVERGRIRVYQEQEAE